MPSSDFIALPKEHIGGAAVLAIQLQQLKSSKGDITWECLNISPVNLRNLGFAFHESTNVPSAYDAVAITRIMPDYTTARQ